MEVREKSIEVVSVGTGLFTIISNGLKEGNYELDVTIDNISMSAKAMENEMNADMSPIIGKSFNMTLSPLGKELNLSGAESLKYEFEGTERNVASTFKALFPDLPEKPLNIGDHWTSKDTIIDKSDNGEIIIYTENKNTLDGFERINGRKCLKVTAQVTGTLSGKTKREGVDIISDGNIEGTDTWYFDHENGVFIKMTSNGSGEGSTTVHAEEIVVIPMKREFKNDVILVE